MKLSSHQEALAAINSLHGSQTMPVSIRRVILQQRALVDPFTLRTRVYFFIFRSASSADDRQSSCSRTPAYLRSENVTYAILTERRVNIHRSATRGADMNIEDRDVRHGRAVDGRLPLTAEGRRRGGRRG